jgi:hypothetical protein
MEKIKCITFDKKAQDLIPDDIREKMNTDRLNAELSNDFEKELFRLINQYCKIGLKKTDLVHKMQYVTKSCEVS